MRGFMLVLRTQKACKMFPSSLMLPHPKDPEIKHTNKGKPKGQKVGFRQVRIYTKKHLIKTRVFQLHVFFCEENPLNRSELSASKSGRERS